MHCYICSLDGTSTDAAGVCNHCGAALCDLHLTEARAHSVGGMTAYRCHHPLGALEARRHAEVREELRRAS